ncbi:MAG: bifunctional glutamate N-acetyltransferase/amino-acid acetyltransferase ArgJ [Chloroflexota bacterium]
MGVKGFRAAGVPCGLKKNGALDFALIVSEGPAIAAGVFTRNHVKAAPLLVSMDRLKSSRDRVRAVVINAGNANAMTGAQGLHDAEQTTQLVGQALDTGADAVLVLSTGVIGQLLDMQKIAAGVDQAAHCLTRTWDDAARAIMTTDTRPKLRSVRVTQADGGTYTIAGIAKGAGMIAPNMATMLGIVVTDAQLSAGQAQQALDTAVPQTFNRIVVDGDMSTNDTVFLLANGASGAAVQTDADTTQFQAALTAVCRELAQAIVRDGEGVTKFVTINVSGAVDDQAAWQIANTIATSPLVKTAFFGEDANWGRIVAAAGRAGVPLEVDSVRLSIAPGVDAPDSADALLLVENGTRTDYDEADATAIFQAAEITVNLALGLGDGSARVWTSDLSIDYVKINADYRT